MAGQGERPTKPITSSDTIALITNVVIPAINEVKGEIKLTNNKLENIESDVKDVYGTIKQFRITLYGNGDAEKQGLVSIVAKLREWIDSRSSYEKMIVGALIAEFLALIFVILRDHLIF